MGNVAPSAKGAIIECAQIEAVRLVTAGARGVARMKRRVRLRFLVALRAAKGELGDPGRMRLVAADAFALLRWRVGRRYVLVAALARAGCCCSNVVGPMTAGAFAMGPRNVLRQHTHSLVAIVATCCRCGRERVRMMAVRARLMSADERRGARDDRLFRLMAVHASLRLRCKPVASVAARAASAELRIPVLQIHLVVTIIALTNRFADRLVGIVTVLARHRRMHREPLWIRFGLIRAVASRAMPWAVDVGLRTKNMARVAVHGHPARIDVGHRSLLFVALGAHPGIRCFEGEVRRVVTLVALDYLVDHVLRVARGEANFGPVWWHRARGWRVTFLFDHLNA